MINGKLAKFVLWQISIQQVGGGGEDNVGKDGDKVVGEYYGEVEAEEMLRMDDFILLFEGFW